jgi:hypothetical protein
MIRSIRTTRRVAWSRAPSARRLDRAMRSLALASVLLAPLSLARAGTADPSGHWEGAIQAPSREVPVSVDLARDDKGKLAGTFSNPGERITGYPLAAVAVDGSAVRLEIKTGGSGTQTFAGTLSADGRSLAGDFLISVYSVPFTLTRTGDAQIAPAPRSPAIDAALVGEWRATLEIEGKALPVSLTLANRGGGISVGAWAADDGSATPVAIAQHERSVTLTSTVTSSAYSGTLSPDGAEITGTFTEGALKQPLTFRRAAAAR